MANRLAANAAAARAGIAPSTWRAYVARGQAPLADGIDEGFNRPYWLESTVDKWKKERHGRPGRPPKTEAGGPTPM